MVTIRLLTIGKHKPSWLEEGVLEYTQRLTQSATLNWELCKNLKELTLRALKERSPIALDPKGRQLSSEAFAALLQTKIEEGGSRLTLIIGGDEGLSEAIKAHCPLAISLSQLTFTHQMSRLILLEQLYRTFEILKNSPYHK